MPPLTPLIMYILFVIEREKRDCVFNSTIKYMSGWLPSPNDISLRFFVGLVLLCLCEHTLPVFFSLYYLMTSLQVACGQKSLYEHDLIGSVFEPNLCLMLEVGSVIVADQNERQQLVSSVAKEYNLWRIHAPEKIAVVGRSWSRHCFKYQPIWTIYLPIYYFGGFADTI